MASAHPILTCSESLAFEKKLLSTEALAWKAMQQAGAALGETLLRDFKEIRPEPKSLKILMLLGKGHNAGDALIAARRMRERLANVEIYGLLASKVTALKPLALKAYEAVSVQRIRIDELEQHTFDVCIDGLLGMQFKPPVRKPLDAILKAVNAHPAIALRAAVDLPSGLGGEAVFQADFTYATGIAKAPLFEQTHAQHVGRLRYLDIGFFATPYRGEQAFQAEILSDAILDPLRQLRDPLSDKRAFGHLFVIAGSRNMPGALLMAVRAAVRSGVGLVTAFVPESLVGHFAATMPEVMWVPWPETPAGCLALEGKHLLLERAHQATALLMGPGMGKEAETAVLIADVLQSVALPMVLDADALTPRAVDATAFRGEDTGPILITPHAGEFKRISGVEGDITTDAFKWYCHKNNVVGVLKGALSRISDGHYLAYSPFGGPVLARGGSGDILAGLLAGLLAQQHTDAFTTACQGTAWHGRAADILARRQGPVAVATTDLLDCLPGALRDV